MKLGEVRTYTENDLFLVVVDPGEHPQYYGPCSQKQANKIAMKFLAQWRAVKISYLSTPDVALGEEG